MNISFKNYYWRWLKNQAYLFIFFAGLMSLARLGFALYFGEASLSFSSSELRKAFWLGFRFDLMPLAFVNALPFLLINFGFLLPGKLPIKVVRSAVIGLLCAGYFLIGWLYVFDYGFYSYFQDHLNILVFGFFEDDTRALIISIYKNYNLVLWLMVLFLLHYGLYRLIRFLFSPFDFELVDKKNKLRMPLTLVVGLSLLVLMARGNFSRLPLSVEDAFISDNEFINEVALNGALTLNRAVKIRKTFGRTKHDYLKDYGFSDWKDAYGAFAGHPPRGDDIRAALTEKTPERNFLKERPPHVVMIVMESFGTYWNDLDSEKFQILGDLKTHLGEGYLFKNFLSSENGTIGSMVSVATSQVIRPGARFLSESEFMKTPLASAVNIPFQESGYETHFVYGGKLGWRDLGKFLSAQKFQHLWGADEIKEATPELGHFRTEDLGNEWGIFDEYLYSFIDEQLRTASKPQFLLVLTTSNHPPFEFPSSYVPRPLELSPDLLGKMTVDEGLARKRFLGFQYANQKVGEFLSKIKSSDLKSNTIIALTGDHSYWIAKGVGQDQEFRRYAVPFYLSVPEEYRPSKVNLSKFGSHEDIFPTLYNLALSDQAYVKLGEDLFSENSDAINSSGIIANEEGAYHHGKFWKWVSPEKQLLAPTESSPKLEGLRRKGQGIIGLTDAYLKSEKKSRQTAVKSDRP